MKKIFKISLGAILATMPMMAMAETGDIIAGNPAGIGEQAASSVTASTSPKYGLAVETGNEGKVATAGYVKGAYNAAIKAVNKVYDTASGAAGTANAVQNFVNNTLSPIVQANSLAIEDLQGVVGATSSEGLQGDVAALSAAIEDLESGTVTQSDVEDTVNAATASYTPEGTVSSTSIETVTAWGVEGEGSSSISIAPTFTGTSAVINPTVPVEP